MNNFVTLRNIKHTSRNWPLKGHALGSADKCTTLLPLARLIKLFSTCEFFRTKRLFAEFSLVSDFRFLPKFLRKMNSYIWRKSPRLWMIPVKKLYWSRCGFFLEIFQKKINFCIISKEPLSELYLWKSLLLRIILWPANTLATTLNKK